MRRAATNARRLQAMTRDVLDTESLESGRFGYAFDRIELVAELRTAVEASNDADPTRPARLGAVADAAGVLVNADADRLQQVLANLLENARKNTPAGEPVELEASREGDVVRVSVSTTAPASTPSTSSGSSTSSCVVTTMRSRVRDWASTSPVASSRRTAAGSGARAIPAGAPPSSSNYPSRSTAAERPVPAGV